MIYRQAGEDDDVNDDKIVPPIDDANMEDEDQIAEDFLKRFLIGSESTFLEIDIRLMLRALSIKIVKQNVANVKLFRFETL
mmetsp:Transcript_105061/g.145316  ORF Transcript_105061/g.145316 Transcript_105061/m.145316 type:complete len:81 (-) Transcript_105061:274-516(-)|eukprot:CAMPEP_0176339674 /NCGR_PEP_ID=MMETSP0126-20121128/965_1 /TAXON_ID=141414 ORGANISM="Strombidinopsis acuminatum, Strain SPMC142" /NCGR_SAMPLE_ID=MMETSP0126 /ASSEMBLY_ACC=CAM_ASM_000229 /LENGTH=80 /DNA_ID=CAMNT_0017683429 /DNA_START=266 /DNA_END=508 /DNA_ORIENTATION=-